MTPVPPQQSAERQISADAKFLGSSLFSMMDIDGTLTFSMIHSRPTARTQAALDELVSAGCLSVETLNDFGGVVYTLRTTFPRATQKQIKAAGKWVIAEPIPAARTTLSEENTHG